MKRVYQIAERKDNRALTDYLAQDGQMLLPMVELIAQAQLAVDEFIDVLGRAALEAVLELSAAQVAGPPHQGRAGGAVRRHGSQAGTVCLSTQKIRVRKPRLRTRAGARAGKCQFRPMRPCKPRGRGATSWGRSCSAG